MEPSTIASASTPGILPALADTVVSLATEKQRYQVWLTLNAASDSASTALEQLEQGTAAKNTEPWAEFQQSGANKCSMYRQWSTWVLTDRKDETGPPLTTASLVPHKVWVKSRESSEAEQAHVYVLERVITPEKNRRQGYASHLLASLKSRMTDPSTELGSVRPLGCLLFSNLGEFYESQGWNMQDRALNWDLRWDVREYLDSLGRKPPATQDMELAYIRESDMVRVSKIVGVEDMRDLKQSTAEPGKPIVMFDTSDPATLIRGFKLASNGRQNVLGIEDESEDRIMGVYLRSSGLDTSLQDPAFDPPATTPLLLFGESFDLGPTARFASLTLDRGITQDSAPAALPHIARFLADNGITELRISGAYPGDPTTKAWQEAGASLGCRVGVRPHVRGVSWCDDDSISYQVTGCEAWVLP